MSRARRAANPSVGPGRFGAGYAAIATTRPARFISRHLFWRLDPILLAATRGQVSMTLVFPTEVLETRGAKTGQSRRNAVIYFRDSDRTIILASNAGAAHHPDWYYNLCAHPDAVAFGGIPMHAAVVEDPSDRTRLERLSEAMFPAFARYRRDAASAGRTIPIVQLTARTPT